MHYRVWKSVVIVDFEICVLYLEEWFIIYKMQMIEKLKFGEEISWVSHLWNLKWLLTNKIIQKR